MRFRTVTGAFLVSSALGLTLGLSGCGITYVSPSVTNRQEGLDVRVLPITAENVLLANRAPYAPRSLPAAFSEIAGAGSPRGLGALPDAPLIPTETPEPLSLRAPPPVTSVPYQIGVGDVLRIATRGASDLIDPLETTITSQSLREEYVVRDDGAIAIPEVGPVQIAGMTLENAEETIFQRLIEAGIDPTFSLEISGFNSKRASVGGNVNAPTLVPITLNTLDLGEALTAAGGIDVQDAQYASIRIYRDGELYQIPLSDFYSRADLQDITVVEGDAIYVDTSYDLDRALLYYQSQIDVITLRRTDRVAALTELETEIGIRRSGLSEQRENYLARTELGAEERDYVYLTGEVRTQARWPLPFEQQANLADVLYGNGGFSTETGNPAQIYVMRASSNPAEFGAVTAWHLDARNPVSITLATNFEMRPDDIVFVQEQPITVWSRTVDQFFPTIFNASVAAVQ